jgi:hypothetical protein
MAKEGTLNIKKRAVGLVATVGLLGGLLFTGAPAAHAVTIGGCAGTQFLGVIEPPLVVAATPVVIKTKTAKLGLVVYGPGFSGPLTTTGAATCNIAGNVFTDVLVSSKLSGVASCDPASVDPNQYPANGKIKLLYAVKTLFTQAYIRIAGFDPVPGPDVIAVTGIVVKGGGVGATVSGEVFFDPVIKALVNNEAGGPELKGQYYFDNSQIVLPCGFGGNSIGLVYGGDGPSLLGSVAAGLSLDL